MTKFENKLCPICRSRFNEKADTVVCPVCGTPHHRVCYMINEKCALEELHASGWNWNGRLPDELPETFADERSDLEKAAVDTDLSERRAEYPEGTPKSRLEEQEELFDEMGVDNPFKELFRSLHNKEIGEDGVSMHELVAYSGTSVYHYGRAFQVFRGDSGGRKRVVFFNFCSGLFAPIFQFYRKMNFFGIASLLLIAFSYILPYLLPEEYYSQSAMMTYILAVLPWAIKIALCLFGDYFYYRHCVKGIVKFRSSYDGDTKSDEYYTALYESGRPRVAGAFIGCLAFSLVWICIDKLLLV